jgi:hypothetical protein
VLQVSHVLQDVSQVLQDVSHVLHDVSQVLHVLQLLQPASAVPRTTATRAIAPRSTFEFSIWTYLLENGPRLTADRQPPAGILLPDRRARKGLRRQAARAAHLARSDRLRRLPRAPSCPSEVGRTWRMV